MKFIGFRGSELLIDYRFVDNNEQLADFGKMVDDVTSGYSEGDEKELLKRVFNKLFVIASERVHGTIVVVVNADYTVTKKKLSDGTWLSEPINLSNEALNAINIKDITSSEKFYGLSGLLIEMMNIDGITVIDNLGRIVAFNVFTGKPITGSLHGGGGARKRAATSILSLTDSNIIGVYFQSQDGSSFYKRI